MFKKLINRWREAVEQVRQEEARKKKVEDTGADTCVLWLEGYAHILGTCSEEEAPALAKEYARKLKGRVAVLMAVGYGEPIKDPVRYRSIK